MKHNQQRRQRGMTFIGLLLLVAMVGFLAYGALRLIPIYGTHMTLSSVMNSVKTELDGQSANQRMIQNALERRLSIENVELNAREFKITQTANGHTVSLQHESRAPYVGNIWLVVVFDRQVEIRR